MRRLRSDAATATWEHYPRLRSYMLRQARCLALSAIFALVAFGVSADEVNSAPQVAKIARLLQRDHLQLAHPPSPAVLLVREARAAVQDLERLEAAARDGNDLDQTGQLQARVAQVRMLDKEVSAAAESTGGVSSPRASLQARGEAFVVQLEHVLAGRTPVERSSRARALLRALSQPTSPPEPPQLPPPTGPGFTVDRAGVTLSTGLSTQPRSRE